MAEFSPFQSQMMMLAGIVLLGWILVRRQIRSRRRLHTQSVSERHLQQQLSESDKPRGVPLASAPPEIQRWQVEIFDLQRELKAELDMKIVVVQSLIRQADERIATLRNQAKLFGRPPVRTRQLKPSSDFLVIPRGDTIRPRADD